MVENHKFSLFLYFYQLINLPLEYTKFLKLVHFLRFPKLFFLSQLFFLQKKYFPLILLQVNQEKVFLYL